MGVTIPEATAPGGVWAPASRVLALDVFRGATVAAMLLVNNPGSWSAIYPPLEHAEWHGWTPTDLIFPFFLFVVGITTWLSIASRRERGADEKEVLVQIVRRGLIIVALGLLLNAFPFYTWGTVDGVADPSVLTRVVNRLSRLRYAGVLQRIGIVYLVSALIARKLTPRQIILTIIVILFGYWAVMTLVPVPGSGLLGNTVLDRPEATLAAWVDRAVLGEVHIWRSSRTWDPEGPLSTIPAIATALLGVLAGMHLRRASREGRSAVGGLAIGGVICVALGLAWGTLFPINKNLWTSSYVVFTAGAAALGIAICAWLIGEKRGGVMVQPFVVFGTNPIIAFVGSGVMARLTDSLIRFQYGVDERMTPHKWIYEAMRNGGLSSHHASLLYALGFVGVWYLILLVLYRRGIFIKV